MKITQFEREPDRMVRTARISVDELEIIQWKEHFQAMVLERLADRIARDLYSEFGEDLRERVLEILEEDEDDNDT